MHESHVDLKVLNITIAPQWYPWYWRCNNRCSAPFGNNRKYLPEITSKNDHFPTKC